MLQGNCTEPVPDAMHQVSGAPLEPLLDRQCLLVADASALTASTGRLWLHGLYFRHTPTQRASSVTLLTTAAGAGQLWITGCTLQGSREYTNTTGAAGLVAEARVYIEGELRDACESCLPHA